VLWKWTTLEHGGQSFYLHTSSSFKTAFFIQVSLEKYL